MLQFLLSGTLVVTKCVRWAQMRKEVALRFCSAVEPYIAMVLQDWGVSSGGEDAEARSSVLLQVPSSLLYLSSCFLSIGNAIRYIRLGLLANMRLWRFRHTLVISVVLNRR